MSEFIPLPDSKRVSSIPAGMMMKPNHDFKVGDVVQHKISEEAAIVVEVHPSDADSVYISSGFKEKLLINVAAIKLHWQNPWLNKSQDES